MNPYFRSLLTLRAPAWFGFVPLIRTALMVCLLANAANVQAQQQGWSATGSLVAARSRGHSATLLANGRVLVVGGITGPYPYYTGSKSAELYDPATGEWSATGSLSAPRADHIAVRLADGKVLVAGGWGALNPVSATDHREISAEIYDPDSGGWSATGNLSVARSGHTATLLADGKVLVTGGFGVGYTILDTAELYDPDAAVWSPAGTMNSPRGLHTATLLPGGSVLVVGGIHRGKFFYYEAVGSTELYDPATRSWTSTGDPITPRVLHTATLLQNGKVLVAGGERDVYPFDHYGNGIDKAELYDPATGQWSATGNLTEPQIFHTATWLPNGRVLVIGGGAELYDPNTGSWSGTGNSNTARSDHTATLLTNGKVLVAGGAGSDGGSNRADLYDTGLEIPLLTLNSTSYCIGDPWNLKAISLGPNAWIRLAGTSNGNLWEVRDWRKTDADGSFSETGTFAAGTEGIHSLRVDVGGAVSNTVSFEVLRCQIQLALNSSEYCTGASWNLRVDSDLPNAWMNLSGNSNNESWEISNWRATGVDGRLTEAGTFVPASEGAHSLRVRIGAAQSNLFSFRVSQCRP